MMLKHSTALLTAARAVVEANDAIRAEGAAGSQWSDASMRRCSEAMAKLKEAVEECELAI